MAVVPIRHYFGQVGLQLFAGNLNFASGTLKYGVLTSTASPNVDTWVHWSDVTNEIAATSPYVAGGVTLGSKTETYIGAGLSSFDAADISTWGSGIPVGRHGILYLSTGTSSTSPLIAWDDFTLDIALTGVFWDSTGVLTIQAPA